MEAQDLFLPSSLFLGMALNRTVTMTDSCTSMTMSNDQLSQMENAYKALLNTLIQFSDLTTKYDVTQKDPDVPTVYMDMEMPSKYTYLMEVFPIVVKFESGGVALQIEELEYHNLFESVIQRYTKSSQKPNPVLRDTRSAEFCYRLNIKVEAVPLDIANQSPHRFVLLREFLILYHLWESYYKEMMANICGPDQMIGIPMPFEFNNVVGSSYDFTDGMNKVEYYDTYGLLGNIRQVALPSRLTGISSTLSYLSVEKLGPSLSYLVELMRLQNKMFTVSSALKVFDQIICRLMVVHKYGVVHGNPNPSSFFFGPGESCNVVYISEFGSGVQKPEVQGQMPRFHDRFVSHLRFRHRCCHFAHDLESAFYVFLYLLLGRLPWDVRAVANSPNVEKSLTEAAIFQPRSTDKGYTNKPQTVEEKEKFWSSPDIFNRNVIGMIELEFNESLYNSFSVDLLESLYVKMRDIVLTSSGINPVAYVKDVGTPSSQAYNYYFGLRRIIATYFRFESLSVSLKDMQCSSKINLLKKQCDVDSRIAWDLSHWCWNYLDPNHGQGRGGTQPKKLSVI